MGLIQASPGELSSVGAEIEAVAPALASLSATARSLGGAVDEPPATAAALARLGAAWATGAARLEDDVAALGRAVQASAVAYRVTDETTMPGCEAAAGGGSR